MPRSDKSSYTDKQKRQAEHIEEGYKRRGVRRKEAERRAWATVNKETGGGKKNGSGRGKKVDTAPSRKGGRIGGGADTGATQTLNAALRRVGSAPTVAPVRAPQEARQGGSDEERCLVLPQ